MWLEKGVSLVNATFAPARPLVYTAPDGRSRLQANAGMTNRNGAMRRLVRSISMAVLMAPLLVAACDSGSSENCVSRPHDQEFVGSDAVFELKDKPSAITAWVNEAWVASADASSILLITAKGAMTGPYHLEGRPTALLHEFTCSSGDRLWVALGDANSVVEVDAWTGLVLRTVAVGTHPVALADSAWDRRALWVANEASNTISRIDMKEGVVTATFPVGRSPRSLTVDPVGVVFVANKEDGSISVVDSRSGSTKTIPVGRGPVSIAYDLGLQSTEIPSKLWVANADDETIMKLDPKTLKVVRTWRVPGEPVQVIPIGVRAWVLGDAFGLLRLDDSAKQNLPQVSAYVGAQPVGAVNADFNRGSDLFWVANAGSPSISRRWVG